MVRPGKPLADHRLMLCPSLPCRGAVALGLGLLASPSITLAQGSPEAPPAEGSPPGDAPEQHAPPGESAPPPGEASPPPESPPEPGPDTPPAQRSEPEPEPEPAPPQEAEPEPGAPLENAPEPEPEPEPIREVSVVGAPLRRTPGSAHVVTSKTLERFGYDDPHAAVQLVPGVYVRHEDGVGLRPNIGIRGAIADRSKKVALMEDGVPFAPAPYSAPAAYYFPMFTRTYQMRVLKGPAALIYGPQTIGGAIDIITRPIPGMASGAVDIAGGDFGYAKFHGYFGSSDERSGFLVEGAHLQSDGFKELPSGADTGFYRNEWMLKGSYNLNPSSPRANEVGLKLSYSDEVSNETYLGLTDDDFERNPLARYGASALDRMRWYRTGVAVFHRVEPAPRVTITTTLYRNDFWRRWRKVNGFRGGALGGVQLFEVLRNPETGDNRRLHALLTGQEDSSTLEDAILIGPNERSFVSQGLMSKVELAADSGPISHRIEYGFRLHNDRVERRHSEDGFLLIAGQLTPDGEPTEVTAFEEASSDAFSLYVLDAASLGSLTLTPGVRLELMRSTLLNRINGERSGGAGQLVLPGVGAFYGLTDSFGVLAGVYRGMSPPPPEHDIEPEVSVNYEAGVRYADGPARAELIGYYNDYSNMTSICTASSGCAGTDLDRHFGAGRARIYGLEAFAEHEVPVGSLRLPLRGSYTLTFTEFLEAFESADPTLQSEDTLSRRVLPGDEMSYVPRHQAFVAAGVEADLAGGFVSANYVSRMREFAGDKPLDEALTTDEQFTVDVGVHYRPLEWLKLYATVRNVFDELYIVSRRPFGARPNAPRWTQLGAKAEF